MNRKYLLPAGIAFGVHAVLLLGFNTPEVETAALSERTQPDHWILPAVPVEPDPPIETFTAQSKQKPPPLCETAPGSPDIPDITIGDPGEFTQPYRPTPVRLDSSGTELIPLNPGSFGDPNSNADFGAVVSSDLLDNVPFARVQPAPQPPMTKRSAVANVVVEIIVAKDGSVAHARVVESSDREFEEPCLRAIRRWRFEPGRKNGAAVPFRMVQPFTFQIRD